MNITKEIMSQWIDLKSVAESFRSNGFNDIKIQNTYANISLQKTSRTILKIIKTDESFSKQFKEIGGQIRYLMLFNDQHIMFVKEELSESGALRYLKFKFSKNNPQNSTIQKLRSLTFDQIHEFNNLFDTKEIIKKFYEEYKIEFKKLYDFIEGIKSDDDRKYYAQILMYRVIFLYFIQTKDFLADDKQFLPTNFKKYSDDGKNFYEDFLKILFFNILNTPMEDRIANNEFDKIPFLNGGLFRKHRIEEKHPQIKIQNKAFSELLNFLSSWIWYVDETSDSIEELAMNPEILGNIFEKTITDQKGKGAYYTPVDITKFITESTIVPYCVDKINEKFLTNYSNLSTITNTKHLVDLYFNVIKKITVLDNACGSGEFLLSASKLLFDMYATIWDKIKEMDLKQIKKETKTMHEFSSSYYYFKKRIITYNLFGVDLEEAATEICKLRLWLSLVSEMTRDNVKPLPNIDYNIMNGNSIIGYTTLPDNLQRSLLDSDSITDEISKLDELKQQFLATMDPIENKKMIHPIENKMSEINDKLNKLRFNELDKESKKKYKNKFMELNPFHWRLHFGSVFTDLGGFDIIVGNPPYVEKKDLKYPTNFFKVEKCHNTYAYFFETSLQLLRCDGRIGYIVPVASISTARMSPLHDLLINSCSELKISSYDDYPEKIFEGKVRHSRSSIILCRSSSNKCRIFTTGYKEYIANERSQLFEKIEYVESTDLKENGSIPKIANNQELNIMNKINKKPPLSMHLISTRKSKHEQEMFKVWFHDAPQYWIHASIDKPPGKATHNKSILTTNEFTQFVITAIINSSLFYWYFIKVSNCRDLTNHVIENFRIDIEKLKSHRAKIIKLVKELMNNFEENSENITAKYEKTGKVEFVRIFPRHGKDIIDKIDDTLSNQYGFTKTELSYIKKFDDKYRMGITKNDK